MRTHLEQLIEELKRLKKEGTQRVYVADSRLEQLQRAAAHLKASQAPLDVSSQEPPETLLIPPSITLPAGDKPTRWQWLRDRVLHCPEIQKKVAPNRQIVFGIGNLDADLFFCGEAPGAEEEQQGLPFVGPAGQLLTKILKTMGLNRETVYIANILTWRPETPTDYGNRPPIQNEIYFSLPYLQAQVEIVQPRILIGLGKTAAKGLLDKDGEEPMSKLHGRWFDFRGIPLLITYHPSYLLHNNTLKAKRTVWEDMLQVMEKADLPITQKQYQFFLPKG